MSAIPRPPVPRVRLEYLAWEALELEIGTIEGDSQVMGGGHSAVHDPGGPPGALVHVRVSIDQKRAAARNPWTTSGSIPRHDVGRKFRRDPRAAISGETSGACSSAARQILEYLRGQRRRFELEFTPCGTEFDRAVWHALCDIPFGETRSYGQIAHQLGCPGSARAVGHANGRNPFAIVVPCHRVIGKNGSLIGYAGGLEIKRLLLDHEAPQASLLSVLVAENNRRDAPAQPSQLAQMPPLYSSPLLARSVRPEMLD